MSNPDRPSWRSTKNAAPAGSASPPDAWRPTASLAMLQRRAQLLAQLRRFFDKQGFLEVETPVLSQDTVIDRHLEPLRVECDAVDGRHPRAAFLQTSPEFHMKRLLAAGAEAIYQVTRAFRGGESGRLHNPEFTMVEWYCVGESESSAIKRLADLAEQLIGCQRPEVRTYRELFQEHLSVDPHTATIDAYRQAAERYQVSAPESLLKCGMSTGPMQLESVIDAWRFLLLAEAIEPRLADRAIIVRDYPASQSALARTELDDAGVEVAKRFELYVRGVELANGYDELLDADELRRRNIHANAQRVSDGLDALPVDSRLLDAMQSGLPRCCGVALGFDRLVLCATDAASLRDVMPFPWPDHA